MAVLCPPRGTCSSGWDRDCDCYCHCGRCNSDPLLSVPRTSAACQRMSTFLFFLAWTFWARNRSSSGRHVWLRDRGKPGGQEVGLVPHPGTRPREPLWHQKSKMRGSQLKLEA